MSTPTWYSIRNELEAGNVEASNPFLRFLAVICSSYSCLDLWYRKANNTKRGFLSRRPVMQVQVMFMQEDGSYLATESWERDTERARLWQTFTGTERQIRSQILGVLPNLSALTQRKRHGEYNFGARQPYEGQGGLVYYDEGTGIVLVSGRFGEIVISGDGIDFDWNDLQWNFDGCTAQVSYQGNGGNIGVCQRLVNQTFFNCDDYIVDPPETDVGCCQTPRPSCEELFQLENNLPNYNQNGWTENKCNKYKGVWGGPNTVCLPYTWQDVINECGNPNPKGCCFIGDCSNYRVITPTTQSGCAQNAQGKQWYFFAGASSCTEQDLRDFFGCDSVPNDGHPVTLTVTLNINALGQTAGNNKCNSGTWSGNVDSCTDGSGNYTYGLNEGFLDCFEPRDNWVVCQGGENTAGGWTNTSTEGARFTASINHSWTLERFEETNTTIRYRTANGAPYPWVIYSDPRIATYRDPSFYEGQPDFQAWFWNSQGQMISHPNGYIQASYNKTTGYVTVAYINSALGNQTIGFSLGNVVGTSVTSYPTTGFADVAFAINNVQVPDPASNAPVDYPMYFSFDSSTPNSYGDLSITDTLYDCAFGSDLVSWFGLDGSLTITGNM